MTRADGSEPAREDRTAVITFLVDRFPERVAAALAGDRAALLDLLLLAAELEWQARAGRAGSVEELAARVLDYVNAVADLHAVEAPPDDDLCDAGFRIADQVDALVTELLVRRRELGESSSATVRATVEPVAREARTLARSHVHALRIAARAGRAVLEADVAAAEAIRAATEATARAGVVRDTIAEIRRPADEP